jgi:hypothetical protein
MSLALPPAESPIRKMFDIMDLVNYKSLPSFQSALIGCRDFMASNPEAKSTNSVCVRANGQIWLISVGRKGGWKRIFNFSK